MWTRTIGDALPALLRSVLAIAAGVAITGALYRMTVDPLQSAVLHIIRDPTAEGVNAGGWLYIGLVSAVRYAPFAVGALIAGFLAPPDKTIRALCALDIAIVLWLAGVF
jgi:hypothetical protein